MKKRMDATNISNNELAKRFVDYINLTPDEQLKKSYIDDVYENEGNDKCIGKFRLLHLFDSTQNNEYLTFTVCFFKDETGTHKLTVHNIEKGSLILECTYDASKPSWIAEKNIPGLSLSSITGMATKLKNILV